MESVLLMAEIDLKSIQGLTEASLEINLGNNEQNFTEMYILITILYY